MSDKPFTRDHLITLLVSSSIGVLFGAAWWFAGATTIPDATGVLRGLDVAIVLAFAVWAFLIGRRGAGLPSGSEGRGPFGRRYGLVVVIMVAAIVAGSRVLDTVVDRPDAVPAWVLLCVGLHFLPFYRIFGSRRFLVLAAALCLLAALAVVLGGTGQTWAWLGLPGFGGALALWAAAAAGFVDAPWPGAGR
ncbi:hypothetical protein SAMN04489732_101432 [Amycolatopsis saalfeldensis]|uniref:Uncharacterized protein n=1 Tax=Amycolatopsis saalfeldensis TaxID=394193 RepID=A0A1H8QQ07_9PSEU|nr:hypothetical protein SAMN04489732_101432 [Amycolatopsis saalfeldensis]